MTSINTQNTQNSQSLSLDYILELNDKCNRVRKGAHKEPVSIWNRIELFFKDLFTGGCRKTDIQEYLRFSPLIEKKITVLQSQQDNPSDAYYLGIKELLHVKAKIEYTGWAESLNNVEQYQQFSLALENLQQKAKVSTRKWLDTPTTIASEAKENIRRWIQADRQQLLFAGYSNEIVFTADEVPAGAVLLYNPRSLQARDKVLKFNTEFTNTVKRIKTVFCRWFTGLPVTHAIASLGGGKYFHVDKVSEESGKQLGVCSGIPMEEDLSIEKRKQNGKKGPKYLFEYEVLLPNKERFAEALNCSMGEVDTFFKEKWSATICSAGAQPGMSAPTVSNGWDIISTVLWSTRPEDYDITKVFQARPKTGYSCSGLISSSLAKYGIDIVKKQNKRVNKAAPADFVKTPFYDLAFCSDRKAFEAYRAD